MKGYFDRDLIRKWDVYKIENPIGQVYIGCTCRFKERMWKYRLLGCKNQTRLYDSFIKYGYDNHKISIIDTFESNHSYSKGKEIFWIKTNMSNYAQYPEINGLNKGIGGGFAAHLQTEENRRRNVASLHRNPSVLIERGKKISAAKMGFIHSKETIDKIRETRKELYGRVIEQYSINGEFIQEFRCYTDAVKFSGAGKTTIYNSLNNLVKTTPKKYVFKYKQENTFDKFTFQRRIFKQEDIKEKIA